MTIASRLVQKLHALLDKLALDLAAAERSAAEVAEILRSSGQAGPDRGDVALAAIALDHYYTSLESFLDLVSRTFDPSPPTGADWHRTLLEQTGTASVGRPAVLDAETVRDLKDLLAFRHFMRHAYAVDLQWKHMRSLAAELTDVHARVKKDLLKFRLFLDGCLDEAERNS